MDMILIGGDGNFCSNMVSGIRCECPLRSFSGWLLTQHVADDVFCWCSVSLKLTIMLAAPLVCVEPVVSVKSHQSVNGKQRSGNR